MKGLKNTLTGAERSIGREKDTGNIVLRKFSYVWVQSVQVLYAIVLLSIATLVLSTFLILIHINHSIRIQNRRWKENTAGFVDALVKKCS